MAYNFDKARLLSYVHTPISFENGTRYKIQKKLSVQGTCYAAYNLEGVSKTWITAETLASAQDYDEVILNGISFGIGKINNVSFEVGNDVNRQEYTFDIECYDEVNVLDNCPGFNTNTAVLIDRFSESLSYEISSDNTQTYTQTASLRLNAQANTSNVAGNPATSDDALNLAETILDTLFSSAGIFGSEGFISGDFNTFFNSNVKITKTRSYSMVDQVCSFSRKFIVPATSEGDYSISHTYELRYQNYGICTITEKGTITGLTASPYVGAIEGYEALFPDTETNYEGAEARCQAIYQDYDFSPLALFSKPIQKSSSFDQFRGVIEYSLVFTNDPKYFSTGVLTFTDRIEINDVGDLTVTEQGSIIGFGRPYSTDPTLNKLDNAILCYQTNVLNGIDITSSPMYLRLLPLYEANKISKDNDNIQLIKKTYAQSDLDGTIEYSFVFTDTSDFIKYVNIAGGFRKTDIDVETSMPVALTQSYNIFNFKQIIQSQNQSTVGTRTATIKLRGSRKTTLNQYLTEAKSLAAGYDPVSIAGATSFIKNVNYNLTPNSHDFIFTVNWNFVGPIYTFGNSSLTISN